MNLDAVKIGERIEEAIKAKGMRKSDFEKNDDCFIAKSMMSEYTNGHRLPSLTTLANIAKKLDVSLDWLCFGNGIEENIAKSDSNEEASVKCFVALQDIGYINTSSKMRLSSLQREHLILKDEKEILLHLFKQLEDLKCNEKTYDDPEGVRKQHIDSAIKKLKEAKKKNDSLITKIEL